MIEMIVMIEICYTRKLFLPFFSINSIFQPKPSQASSALHQGNFKTLFNVEEFENACFTLNIKQTELIKNDEEENRMNIVMFSSKQKLWLNEVIVAFLNFSGTVSTVS